MNRYIPLALVLLCALQLVFCGNFSEAECDHRSRRAVGIRVVSRRNQTGQWVTRFSAYKDDTDVTEPNDITLDLSHAVDECDGKRSFIIQGLLTDKDFNRNTPNKESDLKKLLFHNIIGTNVAVTNNGRTVRKINLDEPLHSVAYTNRPLMDDEVFEVTLNKKNSKFGNSLGIGVTPFPPAEFSISKHINHFPKPSWVMYHSHLYQNGSEVMKNYGKDLSGLVVGDRIGVMRSSTGTLHYFVNGVDQGPAASNLPKQVYGIIELWQDAAMVTIT